MSGNQLYVVKKPEFRRKFVCIWQDETGKSLIDSDGRYLCAESLTKGDKVVESKMRKAASSYGITGGRPVWIEGSKISDMEHDDQMERLLEGKIPDPAQEYRELAEEIIQDKDNEISGKLT